MAVLDGAFGDLRRLADWFSTSPHHRSLHVERICRRLGATAVPLLGRELRSDDARRREAARACLALIATNPATTDARPRVIAALRSLLEGTLHDELKVCVLGLLNELGERAEARFEDPRAMQQRSALALAAQLETAADVANAADMMIRQLEDDDIAQMVEVLSEAAPDAAQRLANELVLRLDLDEEIRERIAAMISTHAPAVTKRPQRPTQVAVLVDPSARIVVVASRKLVGERRWRRWAVLIGPAGQIEDCLYEEVSARAGGDDADAGPLVANLVADGYRIASTDLEHARTVVAAAARMSAARPDRNALPSAYYVGRDLIDLYDAHVSPRRDHTSLVLARALELISDGECTRALALLERSTPPGDQTCAEHAAAVAACALLQGRPGDAIEPLGRAIASEPAWPLHHWNLAAAFHALGDLAGCYHALRRFIATSARPTALDADPDQAGRVASAERILGELQRAARLTNTSLRRRRAKKPNATSSSR